VVSSHPKVTIGDSVITSFGLFIRRPATDADRPSAGVAGCGPAPQYHRRAMNRFYEVVRYGIVGVVNAGFYLALYTALVLLGVPYVLAAVVAFPVPVACGYWLHERWTFARNEPTMRRLAVFLVLQIMGFAAGLGLLVLLVNGLGLGPILARVIVTPVGPLATYLASRALIFAKPSTLGTPALHDGVH
jgi:putative flippase GtrA